MSACSKIKMMATLCLLLSAANCASFKEDKFRMEAGKEKEAVKVARETVKGGYGLITVEELKKKISAKEEMVIVDAMPRADSYEKAHIPGAVQFQFPVEEMAGWDNGLTGGKTQEDFAALLGADKDRTIVVYCGFVKCGRSHNAAVWAIKLGYANVLRLPGGIFAWKGAGYATEKPAN